METVGQSQWAILPDLVMEVIFMHLSMRDRYSASLVCRNWSYFFDLPKIWKCLTIDDRLLTRLVFNYFTGWQHVLDDKRAKLCLERIGHHIKCIRIQPTHSFTNLYQLLILLVWFIGDVQQNEKSLKMNIQSLSFRFPCATAHCTDPDGIKLFGNGGQLLAALKQLFSKLKLQKLKLCDLVLDRYEANQLMDKASHCFSQSVKELYLTNLTINHCSMTQIAMFFNLQILTISPQNIDNNILEKIADSNLNHFRILQNDYTPKSALPCSARAWSTFKRRVNKRMRIHLAVELSMACDYDILLMQPDAPVYSITYNTPNSMIQTMILQQIIDNYRDSISIYGHSQLLPKIISLCPFRSRADLTLVQMAINCENLTTLMIREPISTSTVLLLANMTKKLQNLYVRRAVVILACEWSYEACNAYHVDHKWLSLNAETHELCELAVSKVLSKSWHMLTDSQFKSTVLNVMDQ